MNNNQNIQITLKTANKTITIRLPSKSNLLRASLSMLNEDVFYDLPEQEDFWNEKNQLNISKELNNNREFNKAFNEAMAGSDDCHCQKHKFSNTIEVYSKGKRLGNRELLNLEKWKKEFKMIFSNINEQNVEQMLVHISSNIPYKDKQKIIEDLSRVNIPLKIFFSKRKYKSTLVEIFLFGIDIEKDILE